MRKKKFKGSKAILSLLLSATLVMEPLGTAAIVHAEENDGMTVQIEKELEEDINLTEEQSGVVTGAEQDIEDNKAKDESASDQVDNEQIEEEDSKEGETDNSGESFDDDKEEKDPNQNLEDNLENSDNGEDQSTEDEQPSEEGDAIEGDEKTDEDRNDQESVSENDLDGEKEEALDGFTEMPEDYQLNSVQIASKRDLAAHIDEIVKLDEDGDYVKGEVVLLASSQEEAEMFAEAYNAEIKKFNYGVLTLKLNEDDTVVEAIRAAADVKLNLPAVWPNYYVYAFGQEPIANDVSANNDDLIEIETSEYDLDEVGVSDGNDITSYLAALAYSDEYLQSNSVYYQYHHTVIGSPYAWEAGYTGSGITVAVLDTGVNDQNPDLPTVNGVGEKATSDSNGHGTHVAGIIGASANGQYGVGVAPDVTLYAGNVLPNNGTGTIDDTLAGVSSVTGQGGSSITVDIINMSLGSLGYNGDFQTIINNAYDKGVAIFAAAGNDGGNNYNYPACYDNVISVAATDQHNVRASFSNYGNKVDISAPGVDIYSTDAFYGQTDNYGTTHTEYVDMSGTSMACPVAVGEAAVILSANPVELSGKTGGAKVDALLSLMQNNAVKVGSGMGAGITNLAKVFNINTAGEKPTAPVIDIQPDGESQKVMITITAQAKAQIYYTDNGKNPIYKNGAPDVNTKRYEGTFEIDNCIKGTVKAIAISESGVCSNIVSKTYALTPYVNEIIVSGVTNLAKGKSIQLTATVMPSYAANKNVIWEIYTADGNGQPDQKIDKTSDGTLKTGVSITNKGKVAATKTAKEGSYVVKVTAKDEKKDSAGQVIHTPVDKLYQITVKDSVKINSVKFDQKRLTLVIPDDTNTNLETIAGFKADQKDIQGNLVSVSASEFMWSSSNTAVATVDTSGNVTLKKAGKATITALANDSSGKKATCAITVQQRAESLNISGSSVVGKSKSVTYKAEMMPADTTNKKVTWSLSEKSGSDWNPIDSKRAKAIGVSINANGKFVTTSKAVAGEYQIIAATADKVPLTATKIVTVKTGAITSIKIDLKAVTLNRTTNAFAVPISQDINLKIMGDGADLTAYEVTNSNENIVEVVEDVKNSGGTQKITLKATGKATGKATITVKATDGSNKSAKCTVTVNNSASGLRIAPTGSNSAFVAKGKSLQLKATVETENGAVSNKNVEWAILDSPDDLKISSNGKVSATKNAQMGMYAVVARTKDRSASAIYYIYVVEPITKVWLADEYGNLSPSVVNVFPEVSGGGAYLIKTDKTMWGSYAVSSSNPEVMSVGTTPDGAYMQFFITGKKGSVTVTIKAMDGSGKQAKYKFKVDTALWNKL